MQTTLTPSYKKLVLLALLSLFITGLCLSIEVIFNKITEGTQIIVMYESLFFMVVSAYFALQMLPSFAKVEIDDQGYREIWFFRQRIRVKWEDIDTTQCIENRAGDTLYLNNKNEQFFSRKLAVKGIYVPSIKDIYNHFVGFSKQVQSSQENFYFSLRQIRRTLLIAFMVVFILFNGFYLSMEENNIAFQEQLKIWQQQNKTPEQLFEELRKYGMGWKSAMKKLDRNLYFKVLEVESSRIERLMLKYFQDNHQPSKEVLEDFKKGMARCRQQYLYKEENAYLHCMNRL